MFNQMSNQFMAMTKNFADTAFKAHNLAVEGIERITEMNLKALESNVNASASFWSEAFEARDMEAYKAMWPKGMSVVKASAEKMYNHTKEVMGLGMKTSEALGNLAKGAFEAANENMAAQQANVANLAKNQAAAAAKR